MSGAMKVPIVQDHGVTSYQNYNSDHNKIKDVTERCGSITSFFIRSIKFKDILEELAQ